MKRALPGYYVKGRLQRKGRGIQYVKHIPPRYGVARRRLFVPGRDRRAGFYGRYSGTRPEKKFLDTTITDAAISTTMTITNLTVIPEGNGESERIGRKVTIKNVHVKGIVVLNDQTSASLTTSQVIMMLVQDTQTNGAQFTATDLLDTDNFHSFRNLANSGRFKVLYKKTLNMKSPGGSGRGTTDTLAFSEDIRQINVNKTCNIEMEYDNSATTGAIATVRSNNLYWVTQSSAGVTQSVGTARIRYADR